MIRHILLIKFKDIAAPSDINQVKDLFEAIPNKINGVISVEWGINNSPENLAKGYTHSVFMTFKKEDDRQRYLPHPEHDALKATFLPLIEDLVVFDYQT
ncbi:MULTISPECIES: Dabb family protein [unclassified Photobacterium]|uniref:Dabb family protein n=1 Tax=unclassified Photobacterium TaxID=2628852 RepID=UPI001EDDB6C4|nr:MULTISPECIES: Dabb family protein [unclassified Photobacterium]MCG3863977.1 Dabb family protein [Photobacterium sp. Ph6]MCG3875495.1 Dabb family protein [Photobacterium sp. Ph5]